MLGPAKSPSVWVSSLVSPIPSSDRLTAYLNIAILFNCAVTVPHESESWSKPQQNQQLLQHPQRGPFGLNV